MSANATTAAPTGRKKLAQGKKRSDAALGHDSKNILSPERAKEMQGKWKRVRVGETLRLVNGSAFKPTDWTKEGLPIVRIQNLNNPDAPFNFTTRDLPEKFRLRGGELLFAWSGTPGTSFGAHIWRGGEAWLNQHIFNVLFDENEWDKKFLQFAINQNLADYIRAAHGGAGLAHITKGRFEESELPRPEPPEQRRIVAEIEKQLTRLEAGVAALRRVQANLKRYRAAVLKAACEGKLVPTEAELHRECVGRVPSHGIRAKGNAASGDAAYNNATFETGAELLTRILAERRKAWEQTPAEGSRPTTECADTVGRVPSRGVRGRGQYKEPAAPDTANLPPLPEGWTWASIEQLAALVQYGSSAKTSENDTGIPVLRMGNIDDGKLVLDKLKYLPKAHDEFPDLLLQKGDLLFNRTNSAELVGKTAVFRGTPEPCSFASYLIRVRLCAGYLPDLVAYYINSVFGRAWIAGCVSQQVGQANVNGTKLQALAIPLPPLAEQTRIVAEVERRLSVVEELESVVSANLQRASRLRQSILQKAFTGELAAQKRPAVPANVIPLPRIEDQKRPNRHFARALLSAEIIHQLHREPTFGRTKHQKIFHLCEHIAQIEEIQGQYHREAAGPLDNRLIYANEAELKKQHWYEEVQRKPFGHAYRPLAKAGDHRKYLERYWPEQLPVVEKLINLMRTWDTDRCEIFCTAYAAWNDLILWGKPGTEDNILHEILERWHDSKKRFPQDRWRKALAWMKEKGFVPTGFGTATRGAK